MIHSILHISDLHRSNEEPVDNDTLIAALLADCDRYIGETPIVPRPEGIIVSGDLVAGVTLGYNNWQDELRDQYRVASEFLHILTTRFLEGDRSKLIIIPGNHDVCWNTSLSSMVKVPKNECPEDVKRALTEPGSKYRWSWKELALYQIRDIDLYNQRMNQYWDFIESFYSGVDLLQPIDRLRGYQLFELFDRNIIVVAFDSTSGNDCFNFSGLISRGSIGKCSIELRDIQHTYRLYIAAWHHSIQGPPMRDDYIDIDQIHEMIGLGFQFGIHGHQHKSTTSTHYIHLSESQSMAITSAGSLCAGSKQLPRGVNRQYNVIVIEDDFLHARIHVRENTEGEQFSRKTSRPFLQGFVRLNWQPNKDAMGRSVDTRKKNSQRSILQAEEALASGDEQRVLNLLKGIDLLPNSYSRKLAIQSALKLKDWPSIISIISQPNSIEESVILISALINVGSLEDAAILLEKDLNIDSTTREELEGQIETKRMMRGI